MKLEPGDEQRRDDLLRMIDEKDHLPTSMYGRMLETVGHLQTVGGDDAMMVVCAFLTDVLQRGGDVFRRPARQSSLLQDDPVADKIECPWGHMIAAESKWSYGRNFLYAKCPTHHADVVFWDVDRADTPV
jgi:hypothetical protein